MRKTLAVSLFIAAATLITALPAFSEDGKATFTRKKIAVLDIGANNVSASYGNIVRNSLEVELFNTEIFQLLDRDELKAAASRLKIGIGSNASEDDIIKLGKSVSAQFLISGSIDKINNVKITFKVYSITEGIIITAYTREIPSVEKSDEAVKYLMEKILRDINEYITTGRVRKGFFENHSIRTGLRFAYQRPLGNLKSIINPAVGLEFAFDVDNVLTDDASLGFNIGYSKMSGNEDSRDSAAFVHVLASGGYRFFLMPSFYMRGEVAFGAAYITLKHGTGDGFSMRDNSESNSLDPMLRPGAGVGFTPGHDIYVELTGHYTRYFEKSGALNCASLSLGAFMRF